MPNLLHRCLLYVLLALDNLEHRSIEIAQVVEVEVLVVHQIPLATSIFMTPSIALAWEVNPFGMTKLIAHEVEVTTIDSRGGEQANHLVQSYAAMHVVVFVALLEVPIHVSIDKAEDDGFIAHQCLVVTFGIRDSLLIGATISHFPEEAGWFPIFVYLFFDGLNPIVGDVHGHAVVESVAAIFELSGKAWHARYLFGNGDGFGVDLMNQAVGQGEVADGVIVLMTVKVVGIVAEGFAQAVAIVEHRGYTIEAESIEVELFHPIFAV